MENRGARTLSLAPGAASPPAALGRIAWMAGHFRGELLGGVGEEHWCAPSTGSMMGVFKLIKEGAVVFYEILTISEEDGSLVLRIKHFSPDLASWEEKEECFRAPLVQLSGDTVWFDGFTYIRESDSVVRHIIRRRSREGEVSELEVEYRRSDG
jgi:hypothetical protein